MEAAAAAVPSEAVPPPTTTGAEPAPVPALHSATTSPAVDEAASHYVLALGSLANAQLRAAAGVVGCDSDTLPFVVKGLRRSWGFRVDDQGMKWSALCVYRSTTPEIDACTGLIFAATAADVVRLDGIEHGSVRVKIDPGSVEPWLGAQDTALAAIKARKLALGDSGAVLWAFLAAPPATEHIPTLWYPVLQSYLDVVLAGAATHAGDSFAAEFLDTTVGWGTEKGSWTNDRDAPRYPNASEMASSNGAKWDELQSQRRPIAYCCRGANHVLMQSSRSPEEWEDADEAYSSDSDDGSESDDENDVAKVVASADPTPGEDGESEPAMGSDKPLRAATVRVQTESGWKDQYFVVHDGLFSVFPDESRAEKLAEMPTSICTLSRPKSKRDDAPHCFRIDVDTAKSSSKAGWMTKQGAVRKSWKRRWFQIQLQGTELAYYEKQGGKQKGAIDLTKCQEVKTSSEDVLAVQLMSLQDGGVYREFLFRCDNEDDCMSWVNALSQILAMQRASMVLAASGGLTVGAGFRKKYIVDAITQGSLDEWFAVFGGDVRERKMIGLRQWSHDQAKRAQAGAAIVAKTAAEAKLGLIGAEDAEEIQLLTASKRDVLHLCVDSQMFSCDRLAVQDAQHGGDKLSERDASGTLYAKAGSPSFEALRQAVALSVPASFGSPASAHDKAGKNQAEDAEMDASATPVSRSRGAHQLDQPLRNRTVSGAELVDDPVMLRWVEQVEYQRKDGGVAYAKAVADYESKVDGSMSGGATEAWLGHVMLNDWPSGLAEVPERTVPYVELERAMAPLLLRLPPAADSQLRLSLHSMGSGGDDEQQAGAKRFLLLASGPPDVVMRRCTTVLADGETHPLDDGRLQTFSMLAQTMAEPTSGCSAKSPGGGGDTGLTKEEAAATRRRVVSFAKRWLTEADLPPGTTPQCDVQAGAVESALELRANFAFDELTLIGHLALSAFVQVSCLFTLSATWLRTMSLPVPCYSPRCGRWHPSGSHLAKRLCSFARRSGQRPRVGMRLPGVEYGRVCACRRRSDDIFVIHYGSCALVLVRLHRVQRARATAVLHVQLRQPHENSRGAPTHHLLSAFVSRTRAFHLQIRWRTGGNTQVLPP